MSHFTVAAVCPQGTNQSNVRDVLEDLLAPYYEQGGPESQYTVFKDVTDKYKEKYAADTTGVVEAPDGELFSRYDERFRNPDWNPMSADSSAEQYLFPEGWTTRDAQVNELYPSFEQYMVQYCRFDFHTAHNAWGYYHNPNAKWDWWEIGGRWEGELTTKPGVSPADIIIGEPGVFGPADNAYTREGGRLGCDGCRKSDLDFEYAKAARIQSVKDRWAAMAADENAKDNPAVRLFEYGFDKDATLAGELSRAEQAEPFQTFAVLLDGSWFERGEMGWWACISDDKGKGMWCDEVKQLWDEIPEDAVIVIVDCHI